MTNCKKAFRSAAENTPSDLPFMSATSYELFPFLATMTQGLYCGPNFALKFLPASDSAKLRLKTLCPTVNVDIVFTFAASIAILQSSRVFRKRTSNLRFSSHGIDILRKIRTMSK
ncbi:AAEL000009-PA [Aedes aegypti]|uniref:AAEL000009-PA n=1 Tax=Aedes aegypti TaxID=7159 RepID=Q0C730_AEDAE|nr:AAEL000009-PA [Aedes aegypti]